MKQRIRSNATSHPTDATAYPEQCYNAYGAMQQGSRSKLAPFASIAQALALVDFLNFEDKEPLESC
ncbi:MAG: hypothetical protein RIA63_04175 [Cyclobacteriaceae bacterium]